MICFITDQAMARAMNTRRVVNVLCDFLFLTGWMLFCCRYTCSVTELVKAQVQ